MPGSQEFIPWFWALSGGTGGCEDIFVARTSLVGRSATKRLSFSFHRFILELLDLSWGTIVCNTFFFGIRSTFTFSWLILLVSKLYFVNQEKYINLSKNKMKRLPLKCNVLYS